MKGASDHEDDGKGSQDIGTLMMMNGTLGETTQHNITCVILLV
jgi:hypothetical protein